MVEGLLILSTNWYMMSSKYSHEVASIKDLVQFMAKQFQQDNFINAGICFHCNSNNVQTKEKQQEFINRYILRTDKQKTFEKIFGGLGLFVINHLKCYKISLKEIWEAITWCLGDIQKSTETIIDAVGNCDDTVPQRSTQKCCFTLMSYPHQNGKWDTINRCCLLYLKYVT